MAKKISSQDIFDKEDIFEGVRLSAEQTIEQLEKIDQQFKNVAATIKTTIGKTKFDSTKNIHDFTKATQDANKAIEQAIKIEKLKEQAAAQALKAQQEQEKLAQQREKTAQQSIRTKQAEAKEAERLAKISERSAKLAANEANAYKQLEKNTRELKNESKRLGAEMLALEAAGRKNSAEYRKVAREYGLVTQKAKEGDDALKKLDKRVGDNFRNVGNYRDALGGLKKMLGTLGVAFGAAEILRGAGRAIVDFDQKIADLVSITGASGKDLEYFKAQAVDLGTQVKGGASQVIEAYKLIGSAKPELLSNAEALNGVTKAAITLSQASGMELPEAATALTDAMNQFGASADEATTFIDALANGALFGAAEIPQVTEAMLKFGAVAKTSGVSVQEATGLIEALAEKGLKGAEAGTALRNVMLKLAAPDALPKEARDSLEDLGISFAKLQDKSIPFSERLASLKPLLTDNAALVKTFGKENAVAALNLINNTDRISELTASMGTQGTATKQAEERTKTLSFALNELKESWNKLILSFSQGAEASSVLTTLVSFLADNLGTIAKIVGKVVIAWAAYKAAVLAANGANYIMNGGLKATLQSFLKAIPATRAYRLEQIQAARAAKATGEAVKQSGRAMNAVPWMAIIGVVLELATAFYDVASGAAEARRQQELTDAYTKRAADQADKRSTERQKSLGKEIAALQRQRNENKITEKEFLSLKEAAIKKSKQQVSGDVNAVNQRKENYKKAVADLKVLQKEFEKTGDPTKMIKRTGEIAKKYGLEGDASWLTAITGKKDQATTTQVIQNLEASIAAVNTKLKTYNEELDGISETTKDATSEIEAYDVQAVRSGNTTKNNTKVTREAKTEFKDLNDYISEHNKLMQEMVVIEQERISLRLDKELEKEKEAQMKLTETTGKFDVTKFKQIASEKYQIEIDNINQRAAAQVDAIEERYRIEKAARLKALQDERDNLLESAKGAKNETDAKVEIQKNYQAKLALLNDQELQRVSDVQLEKDVVLKRAQYEVENLNNERLETEEDLQQDLLDMQKAYGEKSLDDQKKNNEKALDQLKKNEENKRAVISATADYFEKLTNKRIGEIDKEINKAQEQSDYLKTLAADGNINAQQSLAEQQRIIDEANRKKEALQKRQQRIKLAESVYSTYSQKVGDGSKNPLAETIRDTTLLQQFIQSLPTFMDGTEDTGKNGQGVDGKGGFHAILHPNERVIPKELNQHIGTLSNVDLARVAQEYNNGKMMEGAAQTKSSLEFALLVNEIKELKNVISDKPETNIQMGQITQSFMEVVESTRKGNTTTFNRFKVRK